MTGQAFDLELILQDIQAISSADGLAAFFTKLGYNTAARTPQTAVIQNQADRHGAIPNRQTGA